MNVNMVFETGRATARLEKIGPKFHSDLNAALQPLADRVLADARSRAAAHIRYLGVTTPKHPAKPGQYLRSIRGGISDKPTKVLGYVRSGDPLAHLLEYGADLPARSIVSSAGGLMAFLFGGETIFARKVNFPGARVPPYPAIHPALDAHKSEIVATLQDVAHKAGDQ